MTQSQRILASCPCGWNGLLRSEIAGKRIYCPRCRSIVDVPSMIQRKPPGSTSPNISEGLGSVRKPGPRPPEQTGDSRTVRQKPPKDSPNMKSRGPRADRRNSTPGKRRAASAQEEEAWEAEKYDSGDWPFGPAHEQTQQPRKHVQNNHLPKWWLGGVITCVAVAAIAVGVSFAVREIKELTEEKAPVFQTSNVHLKGDLKLYDASILYDLQAGESELIFAFDRYRPIVKGVEKSDWDRSGVSRRNQHGEVERLTAKDGVTLITETLNELGRPFCSVPVSSQGHGRPRLLLHGSPGLFSIHKIYLTAVFIHAPFAENVKEWQVERTWPETDGVSVSGLLRYTKIPSDKTNHVSVSVKGTMLLADSKSGGDRTYSALTIEVSGWQDYSLQVQQWTSASLLFKIAGRATEKTESFVVEDTFIANMEAKLADTQPGEEKNLTSSTPSGGSVATATNAGPSGQTSAETLGTRAITEKPEEFYPEGPEWSIPIPKPRPPVIVSEYQRQIEDIEKYHAKSTFESANRFKSEGSYRVAEKLYKEAIEQDPTFALAEYQLACCYALNGKPQEASDAFDRACHLGLDDYPFCWQDDEVGAIRARVDFPDRLREIRARYLKKAQQLTGTPVVFAPQGAPPSEGWPVLFLLHGYGDTNESWFSEARAWSDRGFVAIAMPGSVPQTGGGFTWSTESVEVTHEQIQDVLKQMPSSVMVNRDRVSLLGFSQGAMHIIQVAAFHADKYVAAIAISPGGSPWQLKDEFVERTKGTQNRLRFWFVYGTEEQHVARLVAGLHKAWDQLRWECQISTHSGGHHLPQNWDSLRPQIAAFLN